MSKTRLFVFCSGLCALSLSTGFFAGVDVGQAREKEQTRVFELRTYTTNPGKLSALHSRFRDHTMELFEKHDIKNIGYWTPTDEKLSANTLTYIVSHASREAAKKSWSNFVNDPKWKAAYKKSIEDGKLVKGIESTYLNPTDFSPLKK